MCVVDGPQPAVLQEVNIPVWTNQECKLKYGNAAPGGIVEHFLCAGRATKDSCSVSSKRGGLSYQQICLEGYGVLLKVQNLTDNLFT